MLSVQDDPASCIPLSKYTSKYAQSVHSNEVHTSKKKQKRTVCAKCTHEHTRSTPASTKSTCKPTITSQLFMTHSGKDTKVHQEHKEVHPLRLCAPQTNEYPDHPTVDTRVYVLFISRIKGRAVSKLQRSSFLSSDKKSQRED